MAREDFAVRGVMPEMDPNEVSPLAVQGFDPSQFGGLGAFGDYRPDFSGAFGGSGSASSLQSAPTSFAVPENYGNPKNKIYQLSAAPGEGVRLKAVDGTVLFEGQGPEAAAKAANIVQELGKQFGTQSTWVLDKQPVGGDWKQVSQDTVGEKKTTAVNAFLNVAAPIAGALLTPFIPGAVGLLGGAGASAAGAAGGSLINSGLQNKNSAQAMKDAAIAAAGSYVGAKLAPSVSGAFKGLSPAADLAANVGTQGAGALTQAGTTALVDAIPEIVVTGARNALSTGIGAGLGSGAGALIPKPNLNVDQYKVDDFKVDTGQPTNPPIDELVVTGTKTTPFDLAARSTGSAFTGSDFGQTLKDTTTLSETPAENEIVVTAADKVNPLSVTGAGVQVPTNTTPTGPIDELVVTAKPKLEPEKPLVPTPVILPNGTLNPDFVNKDFTVDNPEGTTETKPKGPLDYLKTLSPLELAKLGLTAASLTGIATGKGTGGSGSGGNTLSYPGGGQPGTSGSLGGIFTSKLPTPTGLAVTPRDMGQRDWLRYGMGPEASFFSNVPDRQALAVTPTTTHALAPQNNPLAAMPALAEKLSEPAPNLAVKGPSVPADGTPSPTDPSIVWNGGVNGGWMQTERGMPPPEEITAQAAFARGGSTGGTSHKPRTEFAVHGAGTGRSDDIPAVLSDGEYVMDAETVALLGDGSSKAGAEKLDQLRVNLRRHKGANLAKGRFSVNAKSPEKYLAGGRV